MISSKFSVLQFRKLSAIFSMNTLQFFFLTEELNQLPAKDICLEDKRVSELRHKIGAKYLQPLPL